MGIIARIYRSMKPPLQPYTEYQASGIAIKIVVSLFLVSLALLILDAVFGTVDASSFVSSLITVIIYQFINYKVSKKILMK